MALQKENVVYDKRYMQQHGFSMQTEHHRFIKAVQAEYVVRALTPKKALVAGCAAGEMIRALLRKGVDAYGFDVAEDLLGFCYPDVFDRVVVGSVHDIPFSAEDNFDTLIATDVFEHLPESLVPEMVNSITRMGFDSLATIISPDPQFPGHINVHELDWWQQHFADAFEMIDPGPVPNDMPLAYGIDETKGPTLRFWRRCDRSKQRKAEPARRDKQKRSVVHILNGVGMGGAVKNVLGMCRHHDRDLFQPYVVGLQEGGVQEQAFRGSGVDVLVGYDAFRRLLEGRIDIAHVHRGGGPEPGLISRLRAEGVPLVIESKVFGYFDDTGESELVDLMIFKSNFCADRYRRFLSPKEQVDFESRHKVLYNPVQEPSRPRKKHLDSLCKRLGISQDDIVVGKVQRNDPRKWSPMSLDHFEVVVGRCPSVKFVTLGAPEAEIRRFKERDKNNNLIFLPETSDQNLLDALYHRFDIYAHSSAFGESFGMTIAEAMFAGKPVVTHDIPGALDCFSTDNAQAELVDHDKTGYVVSDSKGFAEAILSLVTNADLRINMGNAGHHKAQRAFHAECQTRKLEQWYLQQLARVDGNEGMRQKGGGIPDLSEWTPTDGTRPRRGTSFLESGDLSSPTRKSHARVPVSSVKQHAFDFNKVADPSDLRDPAIAAVVKDLLQTKHQLDSTGLPYSSHLADHWMRWWEYSRAIIGSGIQRGRISLDAGGVGTILAFYLALHGIRTTSIDIDQGKVLDASKLAERLGLSRDRLTNSVGTIVDLPYRDNLFDAVFCISVVEHLALQEQSVAIRELMRVLKSGRMLCLTFDYGELGADNPMKNVQDIIERVILPSGGEVVGNWPFVEEPKVMDPFVEHLGYTFGSLFLRKTVRATHRIAHYATGLEPTRQDVEGSSVIVVAHNNCSLSQECLASMGNLGEDCDMVLVDNGSTDETPQMFRGFARAVEGRIKTTIVTAEENEGYSKGVNAGIEAAKGRHIVVLNNDTTVTQGWLEALIACAESDPAIGVVSPKVLNPNSEIVHNAGGPIHLPDRRCIIPYRGRHKDDPDVNERMEIPNAGGPCMLIKRELIERIGGFDEVFTPAYFEDSDFCYRARAAGFKLYYEPKAVIYHHGQATSGLLAARAPERMRAIFERNERIFYKRWRLTLKRDMKKAGFGVAK